jgi:hypothetical protein
MRDETPTMDRRQAITILSAAAAAAVGVLAGCTTDDLAKAREAARHAVTGPWTPRALTADEAATLAVLADLIIPRDDRSGSASDAGVPAYIDYLIGEGHVDKEKFRAGLKWLDDEAMKNGGQPFRAAAAATRTALLDRIAWPAKAAEADQDAVTFFNRARNLTASGFWSSKMGVADLDYRGNTVVMNWTGCPKPMLDKLGVS